MTHQYMYMVKLTSRACWSVDLFIHIAGYSLLQTAVTSGVAFEFRIVPRICCALFVYHTCDVSKYCTLIRTNDMFIPDEVCIRDSNPGLPEPENRGRSFFKPEKPRLENGSGFGNCCVYLIATDSE